MSKSPTAETEEEKEDGPVNFFISYASADRVIATALHDELKEIDRNRVVCFLDTETLESGTDWEHKLTGGLEAADWLVCIYTGEQSEFCGFEIGVFTTTNNISPKTRNSRLVCLHDVELAGLPHMLRKYQHRKIVFPPDPSTTPVFNEAEFYESSEVAKFFRDVYKYKDLYVARDTSESQRQLQFLVKQVKKVTDAFKAARGSDVRSDTPTQLGLTISVASSTHLKTIPNDAQVEGTSQSFALFGLRPLVEPGRRLPRTRWQTIKESSTPRDRSVPLWIQSLEQDMIAAANERALEAPEATFASKSKIYRAILARYVLFENSSAKFDVLMVETLPRQFIGKQETSVLLAGIVLASRFRFAYLEEPEKLAARFADSLSIEEFERNALQFQYDLERYEHEAMELGLLDLGQLVQAFGEDRRAYVEKTLENATKFRRDLFDVLPAPDAKLDAGTRARVKGAITLYVEQIESMNREFLSIALDLFKANLKEDD